MTSPVAPPPLAYFATLLVDVGAPLDIGAAPGGVRRLVPITGGTAFGDGWSGQVLPGGADFQVLPDERSAQLDARYVVELDDGTRIFVENTALRAGEAADIAALGRGEQVDPARIYFRCWPRLRAAVGSPFAWLNERLFVGTGQRKPQRVRIDVFAID